MEEREGERLRERENSCSDVTPASSNIDLGIVDDSLWLIRNTHSSKATAITSALLIFQWRYFSAEISHHVTAASINWRQKLK